jgi:hypothetical protein
MSNIPQELIGIIDQDAFSYTINTINAIYADAETMTCRVFCESCLSCLTAYCAGFFMDTYFEKCLKKVTAFVAEQNETVWKPRGLCITDPLDRGMRVIEIVISNDRHIEDQNTQFTNRSQNTAV